MTAKCWEKRWIISRLSKTAGSVASIGWVENGVKNLLEQVPPEKIILGVPLYMRLWEQSDDGKVSASTLNMMQANNLKKETNVKSIWLPTLGQNYFSYRENGKTYHVWQEDKKSLQLKVWRKGFETKDIWPMIDKELKKKYND